MPDELEQLNNPWLVVAWPGMGSVATLAATHLVASLEAEVVRELPTEDFFEMQHVDVKQGLATPGRLPRNLLLRWRDPREQRDLIISIGEAQPPLGGYRLCQHVASLAQQWNVQRIISFAAMATQMDPASEADVFAVATDQQLLRESREQGMKLLEQGQVSGLNGLMLAAASEAGIPALCLMGEMPYFAVNLPNPPASLAVLERFSELANIQPDLQNLRNEAQQVRAQLQQLAERMQSQGEAPDFTTPDLEWQTEETEPTVETPQEPAQPQLDPQSRQKIESLFEQVRQDRSQAAKLKRELDRHGVFKEYEDRFLDLFRQGG